MRTLFKATDEEGNILSPVQIFEEIQEFNSKRTVAISEVDAQSLVDSGEAVLYDSMNDLYIGVSYKKERRDEYPDVIAQLDQMYHDGFDAWKETIKAVKDAHPKP